jgi:hypothetical protein
MSGPVVFTWDGEAMKPMARFARVCDQQFVIGESYQLVVQESRSKVSHDHFFAALHDAWMNLPDELAMRFPTQEHLRKWSLIKAGYADKRSIACSSKLEARRIAAFIKPMDDYAVVLVRDATIEIYTAQSQSMKAMGKRVFQESKQAALDIMSEMIGVSSNDLVAHAGSAA